MTHPENRLAQSSSAYLRSAAHQPIDWYEFGEEAFEKAKELDRPVLLDIGAVWCHWCHVIDRESYENDDIAALINEHYIPVKVDRDQRPDIDARYQQVVATMSGQGGWPLTGFLTYDGRLIYGGTYFPPHIMKSLLLRIKDVYQEKKAEILNRDDLLTDAYAKRAQAEQEEALKTELSSHSTDLSLTPDFYENILKSMQAMNDPQYGGFGQKPKFPHFSALELIISQAHRTADPLLLDLLNHTLTAMGKGGIYDQVAGGFHRYSVDQAWHVPHFEKMAYDNGEALTVYAQAYRLTSNPFFKEIAETTLDWVCRELSDQAQGGFYASQDADINLEDDGDHFTWTLDEVREILTPQEAEAVIRYYDLTVDGDMHERPGRNVLWIRDENPDAALLNSAKAKMLAQRAKRPLPFIDTTLYTNWNGMLIAGFLEAGMLLDRPDAVAFGLKSLDRLMTDFYQPGERVLHTDGIDGMLDDYAWFAKALIQGYAASGEDKYFVTAQDVAGLILTHFEDTRFGGFFDTRKTESALGLLKFFRKPMEDSPSSSANAVAIRVLQQLFLMTGENRYQESAAQALRFFMSNIGRYGLFAAALGLAALEALEPPLKIELVGDPARPETQTLTREARQLFSPGKLVTYNPSDAQTDDATHAPEARLCFGTRCLPPIFEHLEQVFSKSTI